MDSWVPLLCLIFTMVHSGDSRSCIECFSTTGESCTGPPKVCATNDDVCMSGIFKFGAFSLFGRSCEQAKSSCNMSGSLSHMQVQLATSCCNSDNCNPLPLTLPSNEPKKNGLKCPSCPPIPSSPCDKPEATDCMGQEKWCANVELSGNSLSVVKIKGCATESICNFGNQTFDIGGVLMHLGIYCTPGRSDGVISAELSRCPLLLALLAVLMKISLP